MDSATGVQKERIYEWSALRSAFCSMVGGEMGMFVLIAEYMTKCQML